MSEIPEFLEGKRHWYSQQYPGDNAPCETCGFTENHEYARHWTTQTAPVQYIVSPAQYELWKKFLDENH